jgi:hypothetical protein
LRAAHGDIGMRSCGAPVSSAFLYVGIVAIWAFVLVPRWLYRHHAAQQADYDAADGPESQDYEYGPQAEAGEYYAAPVANAAPLPADSQSADEESADEESADDHAQHEQPASPYDASPPSQRSGRAGSARPLTRSKVLQARRRLLTLLVLIAAVAGACTALKLTAWWACIPPAAMLVMYLLLLRETAIADAEQARRRAAYEARQWAAYEREREAAWQPDEEPSAEIIDISARVGDQLYDQYADATVRAVGD